MLPRPSTSALAGARRHVSVPRHHACTPACRHARAAAGRLLHGATALVAPAATPVRTPPRPPTAVPHRAPHTQSRRLLNTQPARLEGAAPTTRISTLPNGIRVASEDAPGHFVASGVYLDVGTRFETDETAGCSHIIDRMAFKSTETHSTESIVQQLELIGGNVFANSTRENILFQGVTLHKDVPTLVSLLGDMVQRPLYSNEDLADTKLSTAYEIRDLAQRTDMVMAEDVHALAYADPRTGQVSSVGRSLICPEEALDRFSPTTLRKFREQYFLPERMVVAAVGIEHEKWVELVARHFGGMKASGHVHGAPPSPPMSPTLPAATENKGSWSPYDKQSSFAAPSTCDAPPAHYRGGLQIVDAEPGILEQPLVHVQVLFESPSMRDPDIYAVAVLQTLLGGGGSFSAGGPGKGMYTRLYTRVLNQHYWVENCQCTSYSYSDTGLFGIAASVAPGRARHAIEVLCSQLVDVATGGRNSRKSNGRSANRHQNSAAVSPEELMRAKNQLKSSLLMGLESRVVDVEDLGRQVLVMGHRVNVNTLCERIDEVTVDDLQRVAARMVLGQEAPTTALSIGDSGNKTESYQSTYPWLQALSAAERSLYVPWHRKGDFRPTVLIRGPNVSDEIDASSVAAIFAHYGIYENFGTHVVPHPSDAHGAASTAAAAKAALRNMGRKLWV